MQASGTGCRIVCLQRPSGLWYVGLPWGPHMLLTLLQIPANQQ